MLVLPLFLFMLMCTQLVHMFVFVQAKAHHFKAVKGVTVCDYLYCVLQHCVLVKQDNY